MSVQSDSPISSVAGETKTEVNIEEQMQKCDEINDDDSKVKAEKTDCDLYRYINQDYTTEIFKIDIRGLPARVEHGAFLFFLRRNGIQVRKLKIIQPYKSKGEKSSHAYVTLASKEARDEAISKLNNLKFKSCLLSAQESAPLPDPLMLKRKNNDDENTNNKRLRPNQKPSKALIDENFDNLPEEERISMINTQVAGLWKMPYDEQLSQKCLILEQTLKNCHQDFQKVMREQPKKSVARLEVEPTLSIFANANAETLHASLIRSPLVSGYRNKCEFSIGADRTVGFRLGLYKEGTVKVVSPPENCPIVSEQMLKVLRHFQRYLREKTTLPGFNPINHEGYWRQIMVRTAQSHTQCMISIALHQQDLTDEQVTSDIIEPIKQHFSENAFGVCSIFFQVIKDRTSSVFKAEPKLVSGDNYIYEKLMDDSVQFRISPLSFFQINSGAAELLYKKIVELAACTPRTTVLDICCGTGTISLFFARTVRRVIGIELSEDAINDARFNSQLNQIENIEFHAGRAENLISKVLANLGNSNDDDVVAVLDPPRNGLPANLIKAVRNSEKIRRLIYVACEANIARRNFVDLCRPRSKAYRGRPFTPRTFIPVDMFPHTNRCELIILFERIEAISNETKEIVSRDETQPTIVSSTDPKSELETAPIK